VKDEVKDEGKENLEKLAQGKLVVDEAGESTENDSDGASTPPKKSKHYFLWQCIRLNRALNCKIYAFNKPEDLIFIESLE